MTNQWKDNGYEPEDPGHGGEGPASWAVLDIEEPMIRFGTETCQLCNNFESADEADFEAINGKLICHYCMAADAEEWAKGNEPW